MSSHLETVPSDVYAVSPHIRVVLSLDRLPPLIGNEIYVVLRRWLSGLVRLPDPVFPLTYDVVLRSAVVRRNLYSPPYIYWERNIWSCWDLVGVFTVFMNFFRGHTVLPLTASHISHAHVNTLAGDGPSTDGPAFRSTSGGPGGAPPRPLSIVASHLENAEYGWGTWATTHELKRPGASVAAARL